MWWSRKWISLQTRVCVAQDAKERHVVTQFMQALQSGCCRCLHSRQCCGLHENVCSCSHPHVASRCCSRVVLPEPRKPVMTSAGTTAQHGQCMHESLLRLL